MRAGVAAVLAVLLGAFAAHFLLADRGYVLVNFRGYVVEMSVPGLVIVLVLAYLLVRGLVALAQAPRRWRASREQRKRSREDTAASEQLETVAVQGELARGDLTAERLAEIWAALPSELRGAPAVVAQRARALARLGDGDQAERDLRGALKRDWHPGLVEAYGEIRGADPAKQLKQAETWLKAHPDDAALLTTAARLSLANELWGKARSYLEASLALAPEPKAYSLYGRLLAQLGEEAEALAAFRSGLELVTPAAAEPLPPSRGSALPPRDVDRKARR
jgi:HemY protein